MKKLLRSIGPAIIVAAVVLGPGSITTSTKVGAKFGYDVLWLLVVLLILLIGLVSLASFLGTTLEKSLCGELRSRLGNWASVVIGISAFVIVAGFQSSNNIAVITALEPLVGDGGKFPNWLIIAILGITNGLIIAILYKARDLYKSVEGLMKIFVGLMVLAFIVNFLFAGPSLVSAAKGLKPGWEPFEDKGSLILLMGLIGTTFSVVGAFYQGYLAKEKGWTPDDLGPGRRDSIIGMGTLVGVTAVVMMTAAAVFNKAGVDPDSLKDAGAISAALKPLFGSSAAVYIFCFGFLAGAFSSFLVNAMIGGHIFSDGLSKGRELQSPFSRHATAAGLLIGMAIGILALTTDFDRASTIVAAQAATVIGGPAVVAALLYLGIKQRYDSKTGTPKTPFWMLILAGISLLVSLAVATNTTKAIYGKLKPAEPETAEQG